jgi:hypothetical protein
VKLASVAEVENQLSAFLKASEAGPVPPGQAVGQSSHG